MIRKRDVSGLVVCVGLVSGGCSSAADPPAMARGQASVGSAGASVMTPLIVPSGSAPVVTASGKPIEHCDPGAYVGNYACKLVQQGMPTDTPIEGVVSFDLEANSVESMQSCPAGAEFCDFDLVIKEGSGDLFGFVLGFIGFETGLRGGLDCRSGKFHADAVGGIYGVPWEDPNEPGKLKVTVEIGPFDGTL